MGGNQSEMEVKMNSKFALSTQRDEDDVLKTRGANARGGVLRYSKDAYD